MEVVKPFKGSRRILIDALCSEDATVTIHLATVEVDYVSAYNRNSSLKTHCEFLLVM